MTFHRTCIAAIVACILMPFPAEASDDIVAGWNSIPGPRGSFKWSGTPLAGVSDLDSVTGSLWGGDGARDTWGSLDGTYGATKAVGNTTANGAMSLRTDRPELFFKVQNNSPHSVSLTRIVFDFASINNNSPQNLQLSYHSGNLANPDGTPLASWTSILNGLGTNSDYEDVEVDLGVLSDQVLSPGQSATFRFSVDTATNNVQAMALDNIAVLGSFADELRVLTYNIQGGKGPSGQGTPLSNLTAFRNTLMQDESVLCLQEVDSGDCWTAVQAVFSDYPYRFRTLNKETDYWFWETRKETSIVVLSKHPFVSTHSQLIQIDPQYDKWQRHAQHVVIDVGGEPVDIFNFHNTYNFEDNDWQYEKSGMESFKDYVLGRLGISSLAQASRLVMLGDFNLLHANVSSILPTPARRSNGRDHISSVPLFTTSGSYAAVAAGLSDHPAVWASLDLTRPLPSPVSWASPPAESGATSITMTATTATDSYGVEYYFSNTSIPNGSHDSGWQDSPTYIDIGLAPVTTYSYTVKARDKSPNANETATSSAAMATTDDGDLLPNDWELSYFSNLQVTTGGSHEDWDRDGTIDIDEWAAGTDPTDPTSRFHAWMESGAGSVVHIRWNAVAGKTYRVLIPTEDGSGWEALTEPMATDIHSVDTNDASSQLYRVEVLDSGS